MATIAYDASRTALYSPADRDTVFVAGHAYSPLQMAIEASRLAYIRAETSGSERRRLAEALSRIGFGAPVVFDHPATATQAFGAYRTADRTALVAFRGTEPDALGDLATDLEAHTAPWHPTGGRVHAGFAEAALGIAPQIGEWLAREGADRASLVLTGHSLGGALAALGATLWRPSMLVAIGSPRVGDAALAASLAQVPGERIVHCCDVITRVPPEVSIYTHFRAPLYIAGNGELLRDPDIASIAIDRRRHRERYLVEHAWRIGAVLLPDLADHAPINYVRAFFP